MVAGMVGQALDRMASDGGCHIKVVAGRDRLTILGHAAGIKIVALARPEDIERSRESLLPRITVDVPFAGVVGAVAGRGQPLGQEFGPLRPRPLDAPLAPRQRVPPNRLRVVAREQRRPGRPAPRRVVALREPEPADRQPVEVRGVDLATIRAQVGEAQVVGEDHEHVGAGRNDRLGTAGQGGAGNQGGHPQAFEQPVNDHQGLSRKTAGSGNGTLGRFSVCRCTTAHRASASKSGRRGRRAWPPSSRRPSLCRRSPGHRRPRADAGTGSRRLRE